MGWTRSFALGWLAGLATVGGLALGTIFSGLFDASASTPHMLPVSWALRQTYADYVHRQARNIPPPPRFTRAQVRAGLEDYDANCASCHGGPGVSRAKWVEGLTPTPPYLLDVAHKWTPQELRVIVGGGAKMSAMPAWTFHRTEGQLWDLVAFLEALPRLSATDYLRLRQAAAQTSPGPPPPGQDQTLPRPRPGP